MPLYPQKHASIHSKLQIQQKYQENYLNQFGFQMQPGFKYSALHPDGEVRELQWEVFYQVCCITDVEGTAHLSVMATCSNMADPVLLFQLPEMDVRLEEKN